MNVNRSVISLMSVMFIILSLLRITATSAATLPTETIMQKIGTNLNNRTENNVCQGAMPCRGNAHLLVINLYLAKQDNAMSTEDVNNMLFGDFYSYGSNVRDENITDYFGAISYGKLNVTGTVKRYECDEYPDNNDLPIILDEILQTVDPSKFDLNVDGYLDGIIFFFPDEGSNENAMVLSWAYEFGGYKSASYTKIANKNYKNVSTVAHEIIHLMGLPDIYANVNLNPSGTMAHSLMDGHGSSWNSLRGTLICDIPGVMKFFFGWIDNLTEVFDVGICKNYSLNSYSIVPSAMVIYPNGNTQSKFVFFIENITPHGNNSVLTDYPYMGENGGLRIWKVYLNVDEEGFIIGNDEQTGCGNSPYLYLECINDGDHFVLLPGMNFNNNTTPSSAYFESFYDIGGSRYPENERWSGVEIFNLTQTENCVQFDVLIDAHKHQYETVVIPPTCTQQGYSNYTCTLCGDSYIEAGDAALGHSYTSVVTKPTCTEQGYTTHTCACGDGYKDTYVNALGHKDADKDHVCDNGCGVTQGAHADGSDKDHLCDYGCGATLTDHSYASVVIKPTCTTKGIKTYTCHCGATKTEEIAPVGHSYSDWYTEKEATCTENGHARRNCANCTTYETREIPATGHSYSEWEEVKAPTTEETGLEVRVCSNCGNTEQRDLPKVDQSATEPAPTEPNPTEPSTGSNTAETPKNNSVAALIVIIALGGVAIGVAIVLLVSKKRK